MAPHDLASVARRLAALDPTERPGRRHLVAIAGAPGSGKSTIAAALVAALDAHRGAGTAALLAMDGYHFDDRVLERRGQRARKGAPETFDTGGLGAMLARLRANEEPEIAIPVFDRTLEIARAGADIVPREASLVVVEGNYLLLDRAPWSALAPLFDVTLMLDVPEAVLRERLTARWLGFGLDAAAIRAKLEENDLPNGRAVMGESAAADLVLAGDVAFP